MPRANTDPITSPSPAPAAGVQYAWWGMEPAAAVAPAPAPRRRRVVFRRRRDLHLEDVRRHALRMADDAHDLGRRVGFLAGDVEEAGERRRRLLKAALQDIAARLERCSVELRLATDTTQLNTEGR